MSDLAKRIGLTVCPKPFDAIVSVAMQQTWTRDSFDRILVAHASLDHNLLVSKDQNILNHYTRANWE